MQGRFDPQAWLAVVPGNTRARAVYARNGWRDTGGMTYDAPTRSGRTVPVPVRYETRAPPLAV